jgi:hypothetical protein
MCFRSAPCGMRIFRNRFNGGFCQGIDNVTDSVDRSVDFSETTVGSSEPRCAKRMLQGCHGRI